VTWFETRFTVNPLPGFMIALPARLARSPGKAAEAAPAQKLLA
jgi:hypothetical protein